MRRPSGKFFPLAAVFMLAAGAFWAGSRSATVFTVRLPGESQRLAGAVKMRTGDEVLLSYRHSVEKTQVQGRFVVGREQSLRLQETRMASSGTGLPNTAADRTRREDGWIVVDEGMLPMDGIRFRYLELNRMQVNVAGRPMSMQNFRNGSVLIMDVDTVPFFRWWIWRISGVDWKPSNPEQGLIHETRE